MQTNWVCQSQALRFCKNDSVSSLDSLIVTRVESFCEKRDSSRVTIFLNVTRVESESLKIVTRVESLTRVTLSLEDSVGRFDALANRQNTGYHIVFEFGSTYISSLYLRI